jgi:hypothetical protein
MNDGLGKHAGCGRSLPQGVPVRSHAAPGPLSVLRSYTLCNFEQQGAFPICYKNYAAL